MDKVLLTKTRLFEKIEIGWFSIDDMKARKKEFRNFYQKILELFLSKEESITQFCYTKYNKVNKIY